MAASKNNKLREAIGFLEEPVNTIKDSLCILTDPRELMYEHGYSEQKLYDAKADFEEVRNEEKIIAYRSGCETLYRLSKPVRRLKASEKEHFELNNRKRVIKEHLQLLAGEDFDETLYDQLTKEKKYINNTLKNIEEEIVKYKDVIKCESGDFHLQKAEDIRIKAIDAETKFFDHLKSHRKLEAEHEAIRKRVADNATCKEKILSGLHQAKKTLFDLVGPEPDEDDEIVHKKPKFDDDRE